MSKANVMAETLRRVGLRPTEQRIALATILFSNGHRHVTAEYLRAEAVAQGLGVAVATVYNALRDFNKVGLVRILAIEGSKTWFDTNVSDHHHFFVEHSGDLYDIDGRNIEISNVPEPPPQFEIVNVDVVIRLRRSLSVKR